jgi:hypothetical protein
MKMAKAKKAATTRKMKRHVYAVRHAGKLVTVKGRRHMLAYTGDRFMDGQPYTGHVINLKTGEPVAAATVKGKPRFVGVEAEQAIAP